MQVDFQRTRDKLIKSEHGFAFEKKDRIMGSKFDGYDGSDWVQELIAHPRNADKCNWEMLYGGNWADLLSEQPQFGDKCAWEKLEGSDWCWLLRDQPQFADKCAWEKLDGDNWSSLLSHSLEISARGRNWMRRLGRGCLKLNPSLRISVTGRN